jgi:hypothetical protein
MTRTPLAALLFVLSACAGAKADAPKKPAQPVEKVFDLRGEGTGLAPDGGEEKHIHAWEQSGIHPYQVMRDGVMSTELCVVSRCVKCGETLHDCQRKARRRR